MKIKEKIAKETIKSLILNGANKNCDPIIIKSSKKQKSDYQANGIMKIAIKLKKNPKEFAKKIAKNINKKNILKKITISNPCFINFFVSSKFIEKELENMIFCKRLNIKKQNKKKIVVDYSSPNIAKNMHVGHLRSTVIGDTIVRIMEFLGHNVIRENHIGDWGHQYGMIITYIKEKNIKNISKMNLEKLENIYKKSKTMFDNFEYFKKKSKKSLIKMYKNNKKYIYIWKKIVNITLLENKKIYKILNITLKSKHIKGESFYKNMLKDVISDLIKKKIAKKKNGKIIVYLKKFKNKLGKKMGVIIQNEDKTFLYSTIDIACIKHRSKIIKANKIIYYIDYRQKRYLKQIIEISKKAKYINKNLSIHHYEFGTILNKKNKPFMTRKGKTIKLYDLIKKSIKKSKKIILKKNNKINKKILNKTSKIIGVGAIKYFELSKNRKKNYIFNWKKILKLYGNTSIYIQYAYSRIFSIIKKSKINIKKIKDKIIITNSEEKKISIKILQFEEIINDISKNSYPHILCNYLYNLSSNFSKFYEKYYILSEKNKKIKISRIKLILIISKIIKIGLSLLGIKTIKKI
ncbi:arginine--tRNA ligase [Buchnera aphidicola (Ceratovacuna keduensis)]|uniref:arginine--tRNA ligase n=1 Tax=Buchnera aphidicola TaxID=9 RepID=UPI0031B89FD0